MKKQRLIPFELFALLWLFLVQTSFASSVAEVLPVTNSILMIRFDDGYMRLHGYHETGANDTAFIYPLDIAKATNIASYLIASADDNKYRTAQSPTRIGRKSKPTEFSWNRGKGTDYEYVSEHWLYLELPSPLVSGKQYTLRFVGLASNLDAWTFVYDVKRLQSPAVHINQLGFRPDAVVKSGYISHWMGDMGGLDNLPLDGRNFMLVTAAEHRVVYTGKVTKLKDLETGTRDLPAHQSYKGSIQASDIWECTFSDFTTPGEYVLAVEGVGCSYPFEIDPDIYRDAFYYTCRGLYHQRSGIDLDEPYTKFRRPADHHPQITPEYIGATTKHKVYVTSVRGIDLTDESGHNQRDKMLATIVDTAANCWGFYHDAGDWDGYNSHLRVPRELLTAYELAPANFADSELNIPESGNGVPDILDEAVWLINYFKRNVGVTGGIFGDRIHTEFFKGFPGIGMGIPSWEDPGFSIATGECPRLSYEFTALALQYLYCLSIVPGRKPTDSTVQEYTEAALSAYAWAARNTRPDDLPKIACARALADVWMYKYFGTDSSQRRFIEAVKRHNINQELLNEYGWVWSFYAFATIPDEFGSVDTAFKRLVKQEIIGYAHRQVNNAIGNGRSFRLGGNSDAPPHQGSATVPLVLPSLVAWRLTGDVRYFTDALTSADYTLGGNPLNTLWISGLGDNPPREIMNIDAYYDGIDQTIPGIPPYGPEHRCDWMSQPNDNCKGHGPWDNDFALDRVYPSSDLWPLHECWFDNRYCPPSGEYTVHQSCAPATAVYGLLCQPNGIRKPNVPPAALLNVEKDVTSGNVNVTLEASDSDGYIRQIDVFANHQFYQRITALKTLLTAEYPADTKTLEFRIIDNKGEQLLLKWPLRKD